jgi:GR25 family glycosyltransferase involved in LPS biosynthesis
MSHIACWRKVAERELSMALILEDDAELSTDLVAILGKLMDMRCS